MNGLRGRIQQHFCDCSSVDASGGADGTGTAIGGEGVTARDGVPNGDTEEVGDGHRDGDGDDLAELLREFRRGPLDGEHRQSSSFNGENDGDGERSAG